MFDVTVVIPAFNAEQFVGAAIESVLDQDTQALELIVVDDGSTDGTRDIAQRYGPRVRYIHQPNSGGCSSPRNRGARVAQGRFLVFLDADDLMVPSRLTRQLDFMRRHPGVPLVLVDYRNFDEGGHSPGTHFESCTAFLNATHLHLPDGECVLHPPLSNRLLLAENYSIAGSPLIEARLFQELGGFDESLLASEDFELLYRVARCHPIGIIGVVGLLRRLHGHNMSRNELRIVEYKVRSRSKLLSVETDPELVALTRMSLARLHFSWARSLIASRNLTAVAQWWRAMCSHPATALRESWRAATSRMVRSRPPVSPTHETDGRMT